ncbi:TPA: tetratricopeptide repeat protein [Methanosarcina acetivorans]|nr:tetratricopeptide repeat protein [Methanosarcina acetivorans]HIH95474.1 tetratricopeptide repeat protein [Methanosarcina acetivorans]
MTNLSEIRALVLPYYEDVALICAIITALPVLVGIILYLSKNHISKPSTPKDAEALVEYKKYFTEKELEKLEVPYVQRIENNIERDVIEEAADFLKSSEQVLIICGESGIGKTKLAIEISIKINESKELTGNFKFKGNCLFANLRHYKNPKDIEEKLNAKLSEKTVLIFDDYQYNMEVFNEIKNKALRRNSKLIITTRPIFVKALKEKIGEVSIRKIKLGRMDINGILKDLEDGDLKKVERISEGNPAIALLALDYIREDPDRNAKEVFQGIRTSKDFFDKIIKDFQKEYGEDFIEFLAEGELTGGVANIPQEYEKTMIEMEKSGHIAKHESKYHLTPDVLSEYLINREFFSGTILKHSFEELARADNGTYILEMLNSIMKIKDDREIYRKAAAKLLEIVDQLEPNAEQKKKRIKTGIMVYDGFGSLNLVTEKLKEFWTDYDILQDGKDLLDLGIFLIKISKPYEARKCLEKAEEIFSKNHDKVGISSTSHSLGIIYQQQGNYEEAVKKYNQSLEMKEELGDKSGIAITLYQLGNIHYSQGNYEEAVKKYNQSLEMNKKPGDKSGIAKTLHQLGMIHHDKGNYEEAVKKYNQSLEIKEELGDKSGIAITLHQLGNIHYSQGNYEEAVKKYNQSLKIKEELGDKSGIAKTLHQLDRIKKDMDRLKEKMGEENFEKAYQKIESNNK